MKEFIKEVGSYSNSFLVQHEIAIVDDLGTERTLLKERLARQLRQRGTEAELLEFDSGEAFWRQKKRSALPPHFWIFTWMV